MFRTLRQPDHDHGETTTLVAERVTKQCRYVTVGARFVNAADMVGRIEEPEAH